MTRIHRGRKQLRDGVKDFGLIEYGIAITDNAGRKLKQPYKRISSDQTT